MSSSNTSQPQSSQVNQPNNPTSSQQQPKNPTRIERNNKIFAVCYFILQISMIVLYAIFIRPQPSKVIVDNGLFEAVGAAFLVLIGFGLYFTYLRNMSWSGLGFTFLITALVFQYYFLISGFWSKANVQISGTNWNQTWISTYLSDQNGDTSSGGIDTQGNTAVGAFKCALSLSIAFAAIGGRAGPLEAFIIVIIGTITYELNRQILSLFSVNFGGSTTIFEFGGFVGTTIAILLRIGRQSTMIESHKQYVASTLNITLALLGSAFIWVFFPIINMDIPTTLFVYSNGGISTLLSISACVIAVVGFSLLVNGKLQYRDILTAPIAGGVVIGSSSTYIYSPLQSLMFGLFAGILQGIFNKIERKLGNNPFWSNGVFFLFAIQGLLGGLFSSVIRAINITSSVYSSSYKALSAVPKYVDSQQGQISGTFITMGISIVTGLIIYLFIYFINSEEEEDCYHDKTYWVMDDDGISNFKPKESEEEESLALPNAISISDGKSIKGEHAYI